MKFRDIFGAEEAGIRRYSNDDKPKRAEIAPFERVRITLVTLRAYHRVTRSYPGLPGFDLFFSQTGTYRRFHRLQSGFRRRFPDRAGRGGDCYKTPLCESRSG